MLRCRIFTLASCLIAVLASNALTQDSIKWAPNLSAAVNMASRQNQLVLLHFWAPGCGPCKALERNVFSRPEVVQAIARDFVPVKINAQAMPDTARKYKVDRWPMDVIVTPAGYPVHTMVSPQDPREYMQILYRVASERRPGEQLAGNNIGVGSMAAGHTSQFGGSQFAAQNPQPPQAENRFAAQGSQFAAQGSQFGPAYEEQFRDNNQFQTEGPQFGQQGSPASPHASPSEPHQTVNPYVDGGDPRNQPDPQQGQGFAQQQPSFGSQGPTAPPAAANQTPPLGLEGYCPVTLIQDGKWTQGDKRFGIIHRGQVYLFKTDEAKRTFWQDPDRYAPILSGNDPVEFAETGRVVAGSRKHGVFFRNQIYLFISEESLQRFWNSPQRYAEVAMQAMARASSRTMR